MAALAYLIPPWTGMIAFLRGERPRTRVHGLQAVVLGLMWPALLYFCSWISPVATRAAFIALAVLWLALLVSVALGRDPFIPGTRRWFERAAQPSPRTAR